MPLLLLAVSAFAQTPAPVTKPAPSLPQVTLHFGHLQGGTQNALADAVSLDYGGELTLDASQLQGDLDDSRFDATGGVRVHANDTTLNTQSLHVDGPKQLAVANGAILTRRPFVIKAPLIQFQTNHLTATNANITTAPPGERPDIELRVSRLTLTPVLDKQGVATGRDHAEMDGVSLYLLHNHIITIRRLKATVGPQPAGAPPQKRPPTPSFGYSSRFGAYLGYGSSTRIGRAPVGYDFLAPLRGTPQFSISSSQTLFHGPSLRPEAPPLPPPVPGDPLAEIRALTTAPDLRLPLGDPLLFHDYLPGGNLISLFNQPSSATLNASERLAYHIPTQGNNRNDLYVSRYPEIGLSGSLPLNHVYGQPAPGDPEVFRNYLRHIAVYAGAGVEVGRYHEQPTNIDGGRVQTTVSLSLRPLLVAPNTTLLPSYNITENFYTGTSSTYHYSQYSLALSHDFSNYSALGVRYTGSQVTGSSRFNFDVLNSSRELDGHLQVGDRRLALSAGIAYDLAGRRVIDYTFAVAPGLHGFTPVFTYQFFSRTFGVNLTIPGLNF
jgi:hypothetical protein